MGIITLLIVGVIAGWLASLIMGTNGSQGFVENMIYGLIGALVGGFLFALIGEPGVTGFNVWSIFVATVGAAIAIWIAYAIRTR